MDMQTFFGYESELKNQCLLTSATHTAHAFPVFM